MPVLKKKVKQVTAKKNQAGRRTKYAKRMEVHTINMPDWMYVRLGSEASLFGQSDASSMQRMINEWFFDAIDRQRGGSEDFDKASVRNDLNKSIS